MAILAVILAFVIALATLFGLWIGLGRSSIVVSDATSRSAVMNATDRVRAWTVFGILVRCFAEQNATMFRSAKLGGELVNVEYPTRNSGVRG